MTPALFLLLAAFFRPDAISVAEYRDRLDALRSALDAGDLEGAKRRAADLRPLRVRFGGGEFVPDPTVLRAAAGAGTLAEARDAARSVASLREALEASPSSFEAASPPDRERLERLRREEAERSVDPSGRVGGPALHAPKIPKNLLDWLLGILDRLWTSIRDWGGRFLQWLAYLLFGGMAQEKTGQGMSYLAMALVLGILGVVGVVAFLALSRRREVVGAPASTAPEKAGADEDPLSRTSNEWERFAAELVRSGRFREAVRAWYHAILVTLFRSGRLHYRKDRTNWEYAYALGPEISWRPGFLEATRTFEQIWYGRREAPQETADAYADLVRGLLERAREGSSP